MGHEFVINVEIVPPASSRDMPGTELKEALQGLPVDAINVADSPLARARMSPALFGIATRQAAGMDIEYIPHLAVRDRNRVATQGLLWGAVATGARSLVVVSGDAIRYASDARAIRVADLTVPDAVRMASEAGLLAGVVMDPRPAESERELHKLEKKLKAGARFVITQPLYDLEALDRFVRVMEPFDVPVLHGILPLVSERHAKFLHHKVPEITVPQRVLAGMTAAGDRALAIGIENARTMFAAARQHLAGVCIMPPFNRFELVADVLASQGPRR